MAKYYKARKDTNQKYLETRLVKLNIGYVDVSALKAFCDLIVMYQGTIYFFEVKNPEYVKKKENYERSLTDLECKFHRYASMFGVKVWVVTQLHEIMEIIGCELKIM